MDLTWHMVLNQLYGFHQLVLGSTCQYFRRQYDQGIGRHTLQIANQGQRRHQLLPQFGIRSTITKEDKKLVVSWKFCTFVSVNQSITKTIIMTTDYKVTELFCIIDDFSKLFEAENAGKLLIDDKNHKRRIRKASLSDSEIMTILLYFHFGSFRNFKRYYLFFIKGTIKSDFPNAVSYNRFVELESRMFFPLMFFLNLKAFGRCTGITFVDSTW